MNPWIPATLITLTGLSALLVQSDGTKQAKEPPQAAAPAVPIAWDGTSITAVAVKDLAASKEWYGRVLGSTVHYEFVPGGWCEMTTPVKGAFVGLSLCAPGQKFENNGGSMVSLGVKDVAKAKEWLQKNKVEIVGDVVEIPETVKLLTFLDPDGNKLLFYQAWTKQ